MGSRGAPQAGCLWLPLPSLRRLAGPGPLGRRLQVPVRGFPNPLLLAHPSPVWILSMQVHLLAKFTCNPEINTVGPSRSFGDLRREADAASPDLTLSAECEQEDARPPCLTSHPVNSCPSAAWGRIFRVSVLSWVRSPYQTALAGGAPGARRLGCVSQRRCGCSMSFLQA